MISVEFQECVFLALFHSSMLAYLHACYKRQTLSNATKFCLCVAPGCKQELMNVCRILKTSSKANSGIIYITILSCSAQLQRAEALLPSKNLLSMRFSAGHTHLLHPKSGLKNLSEKLHMRNV